MQLIIFSDIDGTLIDSLSHSYEAALPALRKAQEKSIPIVLCSSKSRKEIEIYQKELGIRHPIIAENGGGVFIPKDYFNFEYPSSHEVEGYSLIPLGRPYQELISIFKRVQEQVGGKIKGLFEMNPEEIVRRTGKSLELAKLSLEREFGLPFVFTEKTAELEKRVLRFISDAGCHCMIGTKFYHMMGENDKGKGVQVLTELYRKKFGRIKTVGIGDGLIDESLLKAVDLPFLVKRFDDSFAPLDFPGLRKIGKIGPEGWNEAMGELIS